MSDDAPRTDDATDTGSPEVPEPLEPPPPTPPAPTAIGLLTEIRDHLAALRAQMGFLAQLLMGGAGVATATTPAPPPPTVVPTPTPAPAKSEPAPAPQAASAPQEDEDARLPRGTPLSAYRVNRPPSALNLDALADLDSAAKSAPAPSSPPQA